MKKRIILIIIFIVALISLILYYTYAIDISSNSTTGDADLTFDIDIKNPATRTVTVPANKTKIFDINVSSSNDVTIKYGIAYSGTKPDTVRIAQLNSSKDPVSGNIASNTTKNITIVIENKSNTNYTYTLQVVAGFQNGGNLIVPNNYTLITDIYYMLPMNASEYIMSLSQGDSWSSGASGVYATNSYEDNGVTKYHDYRYVGANVDNWVRFNDDDYRIIGVFDDYSHGITGQKLVKLISANELTAASWGVYNWSSAYTTYANYKTDWTGTTTGVPASANILLNEFYLNPTSASTYGECINWTYGGSSNTFKSENCINIKGYGIQKENLRNYIQPVTWYLYGYTNAELGKTHWYECERNSYTRCTSANSGAYSGTTTASIGLMYVSDYMYASSAYASSNNGITGENIGLGNKNWLNNGNEWTITPQGNNSSYVFYVTNSSYVSSVSSSRAHGLRPTFYLKSTIKIKSGNGTFKNPYIIG